MTNKKDEVTERFDDETRVVQEFEATSNDITQNEEAYLIVLSGSRVGAMLKVKKGMTIGRSLKADFQTPDEGVSRIHVRIDSSPEGLVAVDQKSRNGTYINGERLASKLLQDGDKIRMGTTTILKFSYADKLEESFQQQMYNAALKDPLTHLFNRRHFNEHLQTEFAYSIRHSFPLSLVMMDLDHFKKVNDRHGHLVGDSVLIGLAQTISSSIRKEDLIAR